MKAAGWISLALVAFGLIGAGAYLVATAIFPAQDDPYRHADMLITLVGDAPPRPPPLYDHGGRAPLFTWIESGRPRPTPHVASLEVQNLCDERPAGVACPLGPSDYVVCAEQSNVDGCLRQHWLELLRRFGEHELKSSAGGRSYRLIWFRRFHPGVSIRLDADSAGNGVLTTSWWPRPSRASSPIGPAEITAVERGLDSQGFQRIVADPSALPKRPTCKDATTYIMEASVRGRYRYVARACESDHKAVEAMSAPLIHLARTKTPSPNFAPPY